MKIRLLAVSAALAAASSATLASTDTMTVSASVDTSCSVTADNLAFGAVNVLSATAVTSTSNISVTCTTDTTYNIGLDGGNSADVAARYMTDTATTPNKLNYNLYQESTNTTVWGNTSGTNTVAGTGTGSAQSHTVYGKVPGGQSGLPAGAYDDTINVTVYF